MGKRFGVVLCVAAVAGSVLVANGAGAAPAVRTLNPSFTSTPVTPESEGRANVAGTAEGDIFNATEIDNNRVRLRMTHAPGTTGTAQGESVITPDPGAGYVEIAGAEFDPDGSGAWAAIDTIHSGATDADFNAATWFVQTRKNGTVARTLKVPVSALPGETANLGLFFSMGMTVDANSIYVLGRGRGTFGSVSTNSPDTSVVLLALNKSTGLTRWARVFESSTRTVDTFSRLAKVDGQLAFTLQHNNDLNSYSFDLYLEVVNPANGSVLVERVLQAPATGFVRAVAGFGRRLAVGHDGKIETFEYAPATIAAPASLTLVGSIGVGSPISAAFAMGPEGPIVAGGNLVNGLSPTGTLLWSGSGQGIATSRTTDDIAVAGGKVIVGGRVTTSYSDAFVASYDVYRVPRSVGFLTASSFDGAGRFTWADPADASNPLPLLGIVVVEKNVAGTILPPTARSYDLKKPVNGVPSDVSVYALNAIGLSPVSEGRVVPGPTISALSTTLNEGRRKHTVQLTISKSYASASPATATWTTLNGTATAPSDYTAASGMVTIPAGQKSAQITLTVIGDSKSEPTENFRVRILSSTGAYNNGADAVVTLVNDDK